MKSIKFILPCVAAVMTLMVCSCDDRPVAPAELPVAIQSFVKQYFPQSQIAFAQKDIELFGANYSLVLNDGTESDFDGEKCDKVDAKMKAVPQALVPAPISTYVTTTFPGVMITKIDQERYGYEIELSSGLELKFNKQGALMEMDD